MANESWIDVITEIFKPYTRVQDVKLDDFVETVLAQPGVTPLDKVIFQQLTKRQRTDFIKALWGLAQNTGKEQPDREKLLRDYQILAPLYDCVFEWVEDKEPRTDEFGNFSVDK